MVRSHIAAESGLPSLFLCLQGILLIRCGGIFHSLFRKMLSMNTLQVNPSEIQIQMINGIPMVSSLDVAKHFGKLHKNVLRSIQSLEIPEDFNRLNFEPVEYKDGKGEIRNAYMMTKDGFVLLVMSFTGAKANATKIAYINRFNEMEQQIHSVSITVDSLIPALRQALIPDVIGAVAKVFDDRLIKTNLSGREVEQSTINIRDLGKDEISRANRISLFKTMRKKCSCDGLRSNEEYNTLRDIIFQSEGVRSWNAIKDYRVPAVIELIQNHSPSCYQVELGILGKF